MQESNPKSRMARDEPVFSAHIVPHRSLSRQGLAWLMGFVGVVSLAVSIPFYLLGAWPIVGFMGADVVLIYVAFRYNNATARAYEQVILSRFDLMLRKVSWRGEIREWRFNPFWTRIERQDHPEYGLEKLEIVQGRQRAEVAGQLGRAERADFADAFQRALSSAKRGDPVG